MKQKLVFLLYSMNVGGVEKSLLGLLTTLPEDKYEIHVGLLLRKGGFLEQLPKYVIVHDCCAGLWDALKEPPIVTIRKSLKDGNICLTFFLLWTYLYMKISGDKSCFYNVLLRNEPSLNVEFDNAFAYAGPASIIDYYICKKVKAKQKYGWIHFDIKKFGIDKGMTKTLYKNYKKIYVVSEQGKQNFDEIFPEFKDKTKVRYNVVSREQCLSLAETAPTFDDNFGGKRILTVGRLSKEKGQDVTIDSLKYLLDKGYDVKWYYVGDGNLRNECEQKAEALGIRDKVVFFSTQTNPYGYMRDCDIYMQPSRHEGYCITLAEARCFNIPIVATDFVGAKEQLKTHPQSVVTGMSAEEMAEGIMKFL